MIMMPTNGCPNEMSRVLNEFEQNDLLLLLLLVVADQLSEHMQM
jgi:hypothetical protein